MARSDFLNQLLRQEASLDWVERWLVRLNADRGLVTARARFGTQHEWDAVLAEVRAIREAYGSGARRIDVQQHLVLRVLGDRFRGDYQLREEVAASLRGAGQRPERAEGFITSTARAGLIDLDGHGRWFVTDTGRAALTHAGAV